MITKLLMITGLSRTVFFLLLSVLGAVALIGFKLSYDNHQQEKGKQELQQKLKKQDEKTIKRKSINDKQIKNLSDDDLVNEFNPD